MPPHSSLLGKPLRPTDRMAVSSVSPVKHLWGREKGSKVKHIFDPKIGQWRRKVFSPALLAAAESQEDAAAQSETSNAQAAAPAIVLEEDEEGSEDELAIRPSARASAGPAPLSPADSLIAYEEAVPSTAPLAPAALPRISKITLRGPWDQSPASTIIVASTASSSSPVYKKPAKRRRSSSPEPVDTFATPRQASRSGRTSAIAPPPLPRRPSSSEPRSKAATAARPIKRISATPASVKRPVKIRSPSPSPSVASSAASDLIVVEEDLSATPATWVPPEASPPPPPLPFSTGKLTFIRIAPPDDNSDSSSSSDAADDDEMQTAEPSDFAPSDSDGSKDGDPAERMYHYPTTSEWQQQWVASTAAPVGQPSQAQPNLDASLSALTQPPYDGSHGLDFHSDVAHAPDGSLFGPSFQSQDVSDEELQRVVESIAAHPKQGLPSLAPSPPSLTPTVAGPSVICNCQSPDASALDLPLDASLVDSLESILASVIAKREAAQTAGNAFNIIGELGVLERLVSAVQREWTILARAARDRNEGEPAPSGDVARQLEMIRFWHLTQSALVADVFDRERIHRLLERYYRMTDGDVDELDPDDRIALNKKDYWTLNMLCITLYMYELGRETPAISLGSDIYDSWRTERLHVRREGKKPILPPDRVPWSTICKDLVDLARVVLALLLPPVAPFPSTALRHSSGEQPARSLGSQSMGPLDPTAGYAEAFYDHPDKDEPDGYDGFGGDADLSGMTLVPTDPSSALTLENALCGLSSYSKQREPTPPLPHTDATDLHWPDLFADDPWL